MSEVVQLRAARRDDIVGMHRVRLAVRENRLTSPIGEDDYVAAIESTGRGWVVESDGRIVGFAIGNATDGNVWALFVDPAHERRGNGRRLHDTMVAWLFSSGLDRLWLTTGPGTRAQRFYERAGWRCAGVANNGELRYELDRPSRSAPSREFHGQAMNTDDAKDTEKRFVSGTLLSLALSG